MTAAKLGVFFGEKTAKHSHYSVLELKQKQFEIFFFTSFYFPYISQIQQSTLSTHKGALTQITAAIDNKQSHFVDMDTINYLIVTTRLIQAITVLKR